MVCHGGKEPRNKRGLARPFEGCYLMQVEIGEGGRLQVDIAAAKVATAHSAAATMAAALPEWCSVAASEVYHFSWQL